MRAIWRVLAARRDLRFVLSAGLISLTGDWILRIGLTYRVYALTGSTVTSALTMVASFLPQVLLGALAGVFADRWDRRRTMIVADLLLAAGLLSSSCCCGKARRRSSSPRPSRPCCPAWSATTNWSPRTRSAARSRTWPA
jgi:MFS family permease